MSTDLVATRSLQEEPLMLAARVMNNPHYEAYSGDSIYFHVTYNNGSANFHIVDTTRGWDTGTVSQPLHQPYDGSSAEDITERPTYDGTLTDLRDFPNPLSWTLALAGTVGVHAYPFADLQPLPIFMTADGSEDGKLLAQPSSLSGSDSAFTVTHHACE
jgi:hypothetical protein